MDHAPIIVTDVFDPVASDPLELAERILTALRNDYEFISFKVELLREYARFMTMKILENDVYLDRDEKPFPRFRPSPPVESVWKHHLFMPVKYGKFCAAFTKDGDIIDYHPDLEFPNMLYNHYTRTREYYVRVFGEAPVEFWPYRLEDAQEITVVDNYTGVLKVCVLPSTTIRELKMIIEGVMNISAARQDLRYNGERLVDTKTIEEHAIPPKATIDQVAEPRTF